MLRNNSLGGGGGDDSDRPVWAEHRWAIDLPQHKAPASFTEPITSPTDWCADNWAVTGVFMFLLQLVPDFRNCIVFYFNTIYNKGHPDVYLCQYSARLVSGRQGDANSCTSHDRLLACPGYLTSGARPPATSASSQHHTTSDSSLVQS